MTFLPTTFRTAAGPTGRFSSAQAAGLGGGDCGMPSAQRAEFPQPRPTAWVGDGLGLGGLKGRVKTNMKGAKNG